LIRGIDDLGAEVTSFSVRGEPTAALADQGARLALAAGCEAVVGLGGGSVLDAAKAIASLMTNGGEALDYLELVGRGRTIESPSAPLLAIPTTAGTGSEVTRNAVLSVPEKRVKVSMRSPLMLPAIALVDPELTLSLPLELTASTGLDALTQLIEAYITPRATPMTDAWALEGIARSAGALAPALRNGTNLEARENLALASLLGGFALANAGLGAVHGIAAPLGGLRPVPHGVACALLLPHVLELNYKLLMSRDPGGEPLARIRRVARILLGHGRDADMLRSRHGSLPETTGVTGSPTGPGANRLTPPSRRETPGESAAPKATDMSNGTPAGTDATEAAEAVHATDLRKSSPGEDHGDRAVTGNRGTTLKDSDDPVPGAIDFIRRLVAASRIPGLASYGVCRADIETLSRGAMRASSMKGNPVALTRDEIACVIQSTLEAAP
jgi:alcohol dehydrogenase class IV